METGQQRTKKIKYQVGATMRSQFNGKLYTGEIIECGVDEGYEAYTVVYEEDGDAEVMLEENKNAVGVRQRYIM